jgi:hypothetical protein
MKKRYFWGQQENLIYRFRTEDERNQWYRDERVNWQNPLCHLLPASHPEVRRLNRRMAAGETLTFPVTIGD